MSPGDYSVIQASGSSSERGPVNSVSRTPWLLFPPVVFKHLYYVGAAHRFNVIRSSPDMADAFEGNRMRSGKVSGVRMFPDSNITAFEIVFSSSLTLPGHRYDSRIDFDSGDISFTALLFSFEYLFMKCRASVRISSFLSLNGGIRMVITLSR